MRAIFCTIFDYCIHVYMYQNGDEKDMNEEKEECRIDIDRLKYSIVDSEEINEW